MRTDPDGRISRIRLYRPISLTRQFTGVGQQRQSQEPQAEALQLGIDCLTFRSAEGALTPTSQMTFQSREDIPVQLAEHPTGITVAVVPTPAHRPAVDLLDQLGDGHEASLGSSHVPDLLPCSSQCFRRRYHVEVTMVATELVAVVSQREPQEIQALARFGAS